MCYNILEILSDVNLIDNKVGHSSESFYQLSIQFLRNY
jgi:hypothetical protein